MSELLVFQSSIFGENSKNYFKIGLFFKFKVSNLANIKDHKNLNYASNCDQFKKIVGF